MQWMEGIGAYIWGFNHFGEGYPSKGKDGLVSVKLKARDIVPGWPRGRSTSVRSPVELPIDYYLSYLGRTWWGIADFDKLEKETVLTALYHKCQREMLNQYRERYRTPTPTLGLGRKLDREFDQRIEEEFSK